MTTYKEAGVDIAAGTDAIQRIKKHVRTTFNENALTDIGGFGGCFQFPKDKYNEPVLVSNSRRMSAVSERVTDTDVVLDLMVHDIDIVLYLMGSRVAHVAACDVSGPNGPDHVTALLSFLDGRMASLTASRITQNQIRQLEVTTKDRFLTVDYPNQELLVLRQGRIDGTDVLEGRYVLDVDTRRVFVRRAEPLLAELQHFLGAVSGLHECEVDGRGALRALDLAWRIQAVLAGTANLT